MKKILLFLITILCSLNGWAFDQGNLKYTLETHDGTLYAMVVGFADGKNPTSIEIPSIVKSDVYPYNHFVYGVNSSSFKGKTAITSVTFPESQNFKCINASAFEGCTGLTSITIPSGIGEITDNNDKGLCRTAFKGCTNLKTVTINSETLMSSTNSSKGVGDAFLNATTINMGNNVRTIGEYAFKRGDKDLALTTFNCNKATSIGQYAFENALNLQTINLGDVTTIGKSAFLNCPKLTSVHIGKLASDANLPTTVTTYVFDDLGTKTTTSYSTTEDILRNCESSFTVTNTNVTKLVFGKNVRYVYKGILGSSATDHAKLKISEIECKYDGVGLGYIAFDGLTSLTKFTGKPGYIHDGVFRNCSNLTSVDLSLCTDINQYGFQKCSNLTTVTSLGNLTFIGFEAFSGCTNLTGVIENSNNLIIGQSAFNNCANITGLTAPLADIRTSAFNGCTSLAQATVGKLVNYGSCFSGCTSLNTLTFGGSNTLTTSTSYSSTDNIGKAIGVAVNTINFGDNITTIPANAFYGYGVTNVNFNKVTSVGNYAFYNCSSLATVSNGSNVKTIGTYAFSKSGITEGTFSALTSLGTNAFENCGKLTSVSLGNISTVAASAFKGCTALTRASASKATAINESAFEGCSKLNNTWSVTLMENVTIGNRAFYGCTSLVRDPTKYATSIGDYAFYGCTNLVYPYLTRVKTIGTSAYENCTNLTEVLGAGDLIVVESIGENAFKNTGVTKVELPNTLETLGTGAFPSVFEVKLNCPKLLEKNYTSSENLLDCFGIGNRKGYIEIGDEVTKIGICAFYNDTYTPTKVPVTVEHIRIGDAVTSLGANSFYGLNASNYIYIGKALPMDEAYSKTDHQLLMTCENKVTIMKTGHYTGWLKNDKNYHTLFGKKVKEYVFGVGLPGESYTINQNALYTEDGSDLQRISFTIIDPTSNTNPQVTILDNALSGNTNMEYIDLRNATIIGERAFKDCKSLREVTIGTDDTEKGACTTGIAADAFDGCTALSSIEIRAVYASVDETAFTGVKPFIMVDMSDKATLPSVNAGETIFITNQEARAKELRAEKIGDVRKYKYVTSVQRMECEPADVNMDHNVTIDDAAEVLKNAR